MNGSKNSLGTIFWVGHSKYSRPLQNKQKPPAGWAGPKTTSSEFNHWQFQEWRHHPLRFTTIHLKKKKTTALKTTQLAENSLIKTSIYTSWRFPNWVGFFPRQTYTNTIITIIHKPELSGHFGRDSLTITTIWRFSQPAAAEKYVTLLELSTVSTHGKHIQHESKYLSCMMILGNML